MELECIVKKYYDELDNGRIVGRKCTKCGEIEFPPRIACNACGNFETQWVELSGKGVVNYLIPLSGLAHPRLDIFKPCAYGAVELDEGPQINAMIIGIDDDKIEEYEKNLPLRVKPKIVQREGYKTLAFELE